MSGEVKRPKVLLIGSGVLQAYGGLSWKDYLDSISDKPGLADKLEQEKCPSPLQAIILTNDCVDGKLKEKKSILLDSKVSSDCFDLLRDFLRIDFDHILTTNYTYELEAASQCDKKISNYRLEKMQRKTQEKANLRYLIHTYNQVIFEGHETKVWHIHGEHRKPSSIVLGHYYYGNLLCEMKDEIKKIDKNRWGSNEEKCDRGESWLDAFLFGDIYCVGFGFGIFEFDLWWLLNRKAREKENKGKLFFYTPKAKEGDHRIELFKVMKDYHGDNLVQILDFDYAIDDRSRNESFQLFYSKALAEIYSQKKCPTFKET